MLTAVLAARLLNINNNLIAFGMTLICLFLSGCLTTFSIPNPVLRAQQVSQLAKKAGWKEHSIDTDLFTLRAYSLKASPKVKTLTIYIEGDGLAWLSTNRPSANPSPRIPTGFNLALQHREKSAVAYLARPCQYVFNQEWRNCRSAYWTHLRFSPEVIAAMNQAVTYLKHYYHAKYIILVGYSGGGSIATLVAARRKDVIQLLTIAAVLDTDAWAKQKQLTPLYGSLNPAHEWKKVSSIPQTHWVGGKDTVVPKEVTYEFAKHFSATQKPKIIIIPQFDHVCCWEKEWGHLKLSVKESVHAHTCANVQ